MATSGLVLLMEDSIASIQPPVASPNSDTTPATHRAWPTTACTTYTSIVAAGSGLASRAQALTDLSRSPILLAAHPAEPLHIFGSATDSPATRYLPFWKMVQVRTPPPATSGSSPDAGYRASTRRAGPYAVIAPLRASLRRRSPGVTTPLLMADSCLGVSTA